MGVKRSINTKFWGDPWILSLEPMEKYLMLYLLTNGNTNMLGVYEISIKTAEFELGIASDKIERTLQRFEQDGKVIFEGGFLILINWVKHQSYNDNMLKNAESILQRLKLEIREKIPKSVVKLLVEERERINSKKRG